MATQTKTPISALDHLDFNEILGQRFCDFDWNAALPEVYEHAIDQVVMECATRGLEGNLKFFIAKEWLSPEGTTAVGIPFYLMHPKLLLIEQEFKKVPVAEGAEVGEFLSLLRHEIGHCFDHAHGLSAKKDFRQLFGSPRKNYAPEFYTPNSKSKDFVRHLPGHYAQAHPLEDFAETFAVWLNPISDWRRRYRRRRLALAKLEFVESKVRSLGFLSTRKPPALLGEAQKSVMTLATHYKRQLALLAKIAAHVTMNG